MRVSRRCKLSMRSLTKNLRSERLDAAAYYHSQLLPLRSLGDPELDFELDLLEIELYIRQRDLDTAMKAVNAHIRQTEGHSPAGTSSHNFDSALSSEYTVA